MPGFWHFCTPCLGRQKGTNKVKQQQVDSAKIMKEEDLKKMQQEKQQESVENNSPKARSSREFDTNAKSTKQIWRSVINLHVKYPSEWLPQCYEVENLLLEKIFLKIHLDIVICACILIGIILLIHQFIRAKIFIHRNLLILFANIILLDFMFALATFVYYTRYRLLLFFYKHPCELLTPTWMVPLLIGPLFLTAIAFPHFHFFIMIERWRATLKADKYEHEQKSFGICIMLAIWAISIAYMVFLIISAIADTQLYSHPQGIVSLTTKYNSQVTLFIYIYSLPVIILTAIGDYFVTRINNRKKGNKQMIFGHYSLGKNFQIKENLLAMRLIFPLDISYVFIYATYLILTILIRMNQTALTAGDFFAYILDAITFMLIYMAITIVVYIQFIRYIRKKKLTNSQKVLPKTNDTMDFHFKQLQKQWA